MSSFYSPANAIPVDLAGLSMQNLGESIQALINQTGKSKYLDDVLNPLLRILMAYSQNFDLLLKSFQQVNTSLASGGSIIIGYPVTGAIDGVNGVFTLPTAPTTGMLLFVNGLLQSQGTNTLTGDFYMSGTTIYFNSPSIPPMGAKISAFVW